MKRIVLLLLSMIITVSFMVLFMSCGTQTVPNEETEVTTTFDQTHGSPNTSTSSDIAFQTDLTTLTLSEAGKTSETVNGNGYTAATNDEDWSVNSGIDYTAFDFTGCGTDLIEAVNTKYKSSTKNYYSYDVTTGKKKQLSVVKVESISSALAFYSKSGSSVDVYIQQPELRALPEFKSVEGKSGYFICMSFKTNAPGMYKANVSRTKGSAAGIITDNEIEATGKNGTYTGYFNITVPFVSAGKYYINICSLDNTCLYSIPIEISESEYSSYNCHLLFAGPWQKVNNRESYMAELIKLFYTTYPRLLARWGTGGEPKEITFWVNPDKSTGAAAYAWGNNVAVYVDHANSNPNDIGFFSHEITHSAQQYSGFTSSWWVENMANYGGFRYFHWSNLKYIQIYNVQTQANLRDWGYEPYGDGSKLFFSYMDARWPTHYDENGDLVLGLVDTLNLAIKEHKVNNDDPKNTSSSFNKLVKEVTGFDCIESLRQHYAEECISGSWKFVGFGEYTDNFLTENLENCPNAEYPMITAAVHGDSGSKLATAVTSGDNLMSSATVYECCGQVNASEAGSMLIDGKLTTKWCATGASNASYCLDGAQYWIIIDLGSNKTFNTYTFYNTKTKESGYGNMSEWEIFVSDDLNTWTSADYQKLSNGGGNIASFDMGETSGRYVMLKVYNGDGNNGTLRLYEFQLYNID